MRPIVRKVGMVAALCVASLGLAALTVEAQLEKGLLGTGRAMLDLPPEWLSGEPRTVVVNGARVRIFSGRSELSLHALLDHVEQRCARSDGGLTSLHREAQRKVGAGRLEPAGAVLRAETDHDGVVACLALGAEELSIAQLKEKLERFAENLDVAALGGMRMVRVLAREHGSFFVVAMTEGRASLTEMFPADADAPGVDFPGLPRPTGATRVLSGWQRNGEPGLSSYRVQRALNEVWAEQLERVMAAGFQPLDVEQAQSMEKHVVALRRGGKLTLMVADSSEGQTLLSFLPLEAELPPANEL